MRYSTPTLAAAVLGISLFQCIRAGQAGPQDAEGLGNDSRATGESAGATASAGAPRTCCPEDINQDTVVDVDDLIAVILAWGACQDTDCDGFTEAQGDCNDDDPSIFPGAPELCDGIDNDCDQLIDEDALDAIAFWPDNDLDGFGDASATPVLFCSAPGGLFATNNVDCDDNNQFVNPAAQEICNDGIDNNCDGLIDEDAIDGTPYWPDSDLDGFGDSSATPILLCTPPGGFFSDNNADCDDEIESVNPAAEEICSDGVDNNCDGQIDEPGCIG